MSAADGAADAEVRRVLRDAGETIGSRGRISDEQYARYDELSGAATVPPSRPDIGVGAAADAAGDWTAGLDDDRPAAAAASPAAAAPPPLQDEQRPRTVSAPGPSARDRVRGLRDRLSGGGGQDRQDTPPPGRSRTQKAGGGRSGGKGKGKPAQPWRPTAGVIGEIWKRAAMSAGGVPALQRILAAQAPMAGVALEGALRGTLVDKALLQPAARWQQQSDTVAAMVGVPAMVALITFRGQRATTPDGKPVIRPDGSPVYTQGTELMMGGLKTCLISWLAVSEQHAEEVIAQAEETMRLGSQADAIIRWIFSPADPAQTYDDVAAEAGRRPWAPDDAPPPADPAHGPGEPPPPAQGGASSAFAPALTGSVLPRGGGG